jgi:hypothetical protein
MNSAPRSGGGIGVDVTGPHVSVINLVVHDHQKSGIGLWTGAVDAELYGSLIYHNGTEDNLDHGIYTQNAEGTKRIGDNIVFENLAYGIHAYGSEAARLVGFTLVGNASFDNGALSDRHIRPNILIGGGTAVDRLTLDSNYTYTSDGLLEAFGSAELASERRPGKTVELGYAFTPNGGIQMRHNLWVGGAPTLRFSHWAHAEISDNTFVGRDRLLLVSGPVGAWRWERNTWYAADPARAWETDAGVRDWAGFRSATGLGGSDQVPAARPTGTQVVVRPNTYEPGRANVIVYNWAQASSVSVDLGAVLPVGARYEVRNAQNFYGPLVASGTYGGGALALPMSGLTSVAPLGATAGAQPTTGPEFNVFVVRRTD